MPVITYATRRATFCHGPYDRMVMHIVLRDGKEVMSSRHPSDLVAWVERTSAPPELPTDDDGDVRY